MYVFSALEHSLVVVKQDMLCLLRPYVYFVLFLILSLIHPTPPRMFRDSPTQTIMTPIRPNARSLPPWPHRHHKPSASLGCNGVTTNTSRRNASHESPQVAAVTNDDFPRVLNGPAPGYAEDALRRLLLCAPSLDILEGGTLIVNSAYRDGDHSSLPWPKSKRRLNSVAKFELLPSPSATASLKWDDGGATAALAEKASPGGQQQQVGQHWSNLYYAQFPVLVF